MFESADALFPIESVHHMLLAMRGLRVEVLIIPSIELLALRRPLRALLPAQYFLVHPLRHLRPLPELYPPWQFFGVVPNFLAVERVERGLVVLGLEVVGRGGNAGFCAD